MVRRRLVRERSRRSTAFRELAAQAAIEQEERESTAIAEERADVRRLLGMLRKDDDRHALARRPGLN